MQTWNGLRTAALIDTPCWLIASDNPLDYLVINKHSGGPAYRISVTRQQVTLRKLRGRSFGQNHSVIRYLGNKLAQNHPVRFLPRMLPSPALQALLEFMHLRCT